MSIRKRYYYPLTEAARIYGCERDDLAHFVEIGEIRASVRANFQGGELIDLGFDANTDTYRIISAEGIYDLCERVVCKLLSIPNEEVGVEYLDPTDLSKMLLRNNNSTANLIDYVHGDFEGYNVSVPTYEVTDEHPDYGVIVTDTGYNVLVKSDMLVIRTKELERFFSEKSTSGQTSQKKLPKELACAVAVYEEFWEDRPQDSNPAREEDINAFIKGEMSGHIAESALDRIRTIARPENERKGGAHSSDKKTYKGKSKENI